MALVREEDRTISVAVKGSDKTNYLSVLRATLNDIFNSYKCRKPEMQYRIEQFGQIPDAVAERTPLWLSGAKIYNHADANRLYFEDLTGRDMDLTYVRDIYNIRAENLLWGGRENQLLHDHSRHVTFNFHECNIGLQGNLNELAQLLAERGNEEAAEELKNAASALEQAEKLKTPEEIKKKGLANPLRRLVETLGDENSGLNTAVRGIKNGIGIAQDIANGYNGIAQWLGLPQVPNVFLKKDGEGERISDNSRW